MKKIVVLVSWLLANVAFATPDFVALNNTSWQQEGAAEGKYLINFDLSFDNVHLIFLGKAACNRYFGSFIQNEDQFITAGPIGSTLMHCGAEQTKENEFLAMLYLTVDMQLNGDQLHLIDKNGTVLLKFKKRSYR